MKKKAEKYIKRGNMNYIGSVNQEWQSRHGLHDTSLPHWARSANKIISNFKVYFMPP